MTMAPCDAQARIRHLEAALRNQPCSCEWRTSYGVACTGPHHGAKAAVCSRCEALGGQFIPWQEMGAAVGKQQPRHTQAGADTLGQMLSDAAEALSQLQDP